MYQFLRSCLFCLEAEKAHHLALQALRFTPPFCYRRPDCGAPITKMGLRFAHPIGLAAGLDKDGKYLKGLAKIPFSFLEIGTVTPKPQAGNPCPRLFRLVDDEAIINRMGFNNHGVDALAKNVASFAYSGVLGINIGKNKDTPLERAADDYRIAMQKIYTGADYITINISSPNTPDLRKLQESEYFETLIRDLVEQRKKLEDTHQRHTPLLIKLSPDESDESLKRLADMIMRQSLEGIILTNTTNARPGHLQSASRDEPGGLSGQPLRARANACMRTVRAEVGSDICIIGVGGIDGVDAAKERLEAGADLLQVYSGLIYKGPSLVNRIVNGLQKV